MRAKDLKPKVVVAGLLAVCIIEGWGKIIRSEKAENPTPIKGPSSSLSLNCSPATL